MVGPKRKIKRELVPQGVACNRCWIVNKKKVPATVTLVGAIRVDTCEDCEPVVEALLEGE